MRRSIAIALIFSGCGGEAELGFDTICAELSASKRRERATLIRDTAFMNGLTNGALLGGIGDNETGLAHCWSEATWACQGPASSSCGGGPVIAGAGDGPCELEQGGLGIFQFDGGTYAQTLARDGEEILTIEGNVAHVVEFVRRMVVRSQFIEGVDTEAEALAWMNQVPIQQGDARYEAWIDTVTRYYNGCSPSSSCWTTRRSHYETKTRGIDAEMGEDFWRGTTPVCAPAPRAGRTIDDVDGCYVDAGPAATWRTERGGIGDRIRWTYATSSADDANYAEWSLAVSEPGYYRLEVHTPHSEFFASRQAPYRFLRGAEELAFTIDQTAVDGWQLLGELALSPGDGAKLHLGDATGEPYSDRVKLGFDAVRLTRVEPTPPAPGASPVEVTPREDAIASGERIEAEAPAPASITPPTGEVEGGCRATAPSDGALWLVLAAMALSRRRARR